MCKISDTDGDSGYFCVESVTGGYLKEKIDDTLHGRWPLQIHVRLVRINLSPGA